MRLVVLPQLIRIALPGLANLWLNLLKDTALVSAIGLPDTLRQAGIAARVTKEAFLFFGVACFDLPRARHDFLGRHPRHRAQGRQQRGSAMSVVENPAADVERPPALARQWTRERIVGHALVGLWCLVGIGLVTYLVGAWNPALFERYLPLYMSGLGVTLSLVALSMVIGAILSVPIAYARMSQEPAAQRPGLRLCLFLPRHAAARADLPRLLRPRLLPRRSSRRSGSGPSSARPGTAASSPSR